MQHQSLIYPWEQHTFVFVMGMLTAVWTSLSQHCCSEQWRSSTSGGWSSTTFGSLSPWAHTSSGMPTKPCGTAYWSAPQWCTTSISKCWTDLTWPNLRSWSLWALSCRSCWKSGQNCLSNWSTCFLYAQGSAGKWKSNSPWRGSELTYVSRVKLLKAVVLSQAILRCLFGSTYQVLRVLAMGWVGLSTRPLCLWVVDSSRFQTRVLCRPAAAQSSHALRDSKWNLRTDLWRGSDCLPLAFCCGAG